MGARSRCCHRCLLCHRDCDVRGERGKETHLIRVDTIVTDLDYYIILSHECGVVKCRYLDPVGVVTTTFITRPRNVRPRIPAAQVLLLAFSSFKASFLPNFHVRRAFFFEKKVQVFKFYLIFGPPRKVFEIFFLLFYPSFPSFTGSMTFLSLTAFFIMSPKRPFRFGTFFRFSPIIPKSSYHLSSCQW